MQFALGFAAGGAVTYGVIWLRYWWSHYGPLRTAFHPRSPEGAEERSPKGQ